MSLVLVKKIAKRVVKFLAILFVALFILAKLMHIDSLHLKHTLAYVIHNTNSVNFDEMDGTGIGLSSSYKDGDYGKMFDLLRSTSNFHQKPLGTAANIRVLFTLKEDNDDYPRMYKYLPDTGEIGSGDEWCTVPPELKNWIAQQLALSEKQTADSQSQTSH